MIIGLGIAGGIVLALVSVFLVRNEHDEYRHRTYGNFPKDRIS